MAMLNNQMVYFNMLCRNPEMIGSQDVIDYITIIDNNVSHVISYYHIAFELQPYLGSVKSPVSLYKQGISR